mgnify:CR=1 FL=1
MWPSFKGGNGSIRADATADARSARVSVTVPEDAFHVPVRTRGTPMYELSAAEVAKLLNFGTKELPAAGEFAAWQSPPRSEVTHVAR